jgi:predicted O-methyltransferase YrrM
MNPPASLKRRTFLERTAALSLFSFLGSTWNISAAEAASPSRLDKNIEDILTEMETKGRNMLSVPRKDGEFLRLLVKIAQAKSILEIGTSQGYSAMWLSLGLQETGGKLTTVEILPDRVQLAKTYLARAGFDKHITFHQGDAHKIVPTLKGPFDFVLLDADKQGGVDYFNKLFPDKLTPGALLVAHNVIELKDMVEDYLKLVSNHPEFDSVILSLTMEDGFAVSYRHRK